jgi:Mitochondrial carrier protein
MFSLNKTEVVVADEQLARPTTVLMAAPQQDASNMNPNHSDDKTSAALSGHGMEAAKDIAYGSIAGIVGKMIEYPFDTVKVRLQAQPEHLPLMYTGPWDCFKQSVNQHGFSGLYRGVSAPLVGAAVETSSLFFSVS